MILGSLLKEWEWDVRRPNEPCLTGMLVFLHVCCMRVITEVRKQIILIIIIIIITVSFPSNCLSMLNLVPFMQGRTHI